MSAIAISNEMQAERTLVVCPASIRYQWAERILEWATGNPTLRDVSVIVSSRRGIPNPLRKWTIISWDWSGRRGYGVLLPRNGSITLS